MAEEQTRRKKPLHGWYFYWTQSTEAPQANTPADPEWDPDWDPFVENEWWAE